MLTFACAGLVYFELSGGFSGGLGSEEAKVVPGLNGEQMFYDLGGAAGAVPVVVFVTPWCPTCRALEAELEKREVQFLLADVEKSQEAYRYFKVVIEQAPSGPVPITVVGAQRIVGYKPDQIQEAIRSYSL